MDGVQVAFLGLSLAEASLSIRRIGINFLRRDATGPIPEVEGDNLRFQVWKFYLCVGG